MTTFPRLLAWLRYDTRTPSPTWSTSSTSSGRKRAAACAARRRVSCSMAIERAVLSVSDKHGIVDLAKALRQRGVEILSTGGTAKHLADAGIEVTPVSKWSGAPEILGGRVKTLMPKVFGAILFDRDNPAHRAEAPPPIDLVVVNL